MTLLEHLIGKGKDVRVWDQYIRLNNIYGSNRDFMLGAIPHIGRLLMDEVADVLGWASHVVVTQAPSGDVAKQIVDSELPVIELWRG